MEGWMDVWSGDDDSMTMIQSMIKMIDDDNDADDNEN